MEYEIQVCLELRGVLFRSQAEDGIRDSSVTGVQTYAVFFLRSEEHTSKLQSHLNLVCRLLLEKKRSQLELLATRISTTTYLLVAPSHVQISPLQLQYIVCR